MRLPVDASGSPGLSGLSGLPSLMASPGWVAAVLGTKSMLLHQRQLKERSVGTRDSVDTVDLVICILSVLGSLVIIVPYCYNRRSRKLRHSLILGLATSDLVSRCVCGRGEQRGRCARPRLTLAPPRAPA